MSAGTGRESDKFMLRLPDGMRDRIKDAAETNNRSMNAEIVATLEEKYPSPPPLGDAISLATSTAETLRQAIRDSRSATDPEIKQAIYVLTYALTGLKHDVEKFGLPDE